MKKILLFVLMLCATGAVFAQTFFIDNGIIYEVTTPKTVKIFFTNSVKSEIIIPDSVTDSGIKYAVTSIGQGGFGNRKNLKSLEISKTVIEIDAEAFLGCFSLNMVKVNHLTPLVISSNLFHTINFNTAILKVPNGTLSAYKAAPVWKDFGTIVEKIPLYFTHSGINYNITSDSTVEVGLNPNFAGAAVLPKNVTNDGKHFIVKTIRDSAFFASKVTSLDIPNSVTSIGNYAFANCNDLIAVTINWTKPLTINSNVFNGLQFALANLYVPAGFSAAYKVASVWKNFGIIWTMQPLTFTVNDIKYKVTSPTTVEVDYNAYLKGDIIIPNSVVNAGVWYNVTAIGENAFMPSPFFFANSLLTSVIIPNSVKIINTRAFANCTLLTSINIANSVTSIGVSAFSNCLNLTTLNIPNSVTKIDGFAFSRCNSLKSIYIDLSTPLPLSQDSITFDAITTSSATLYVPAGTLAAYKAAPVWKDFGTIIEMQPITFTYQGINFKTTSPTTVEITANPSFTGALNIPSSITYEGITYDVVSIANNAFAGSGITTINIPSSVITIGNYAFANLTGLTNVTVNWASPLVIDASVFGNLPTPILLAKAQLSKPTKVALAKTNISTVTLKVPAGTLVAYKTTSTWKDFGTIIEQSVLPLSLITFTAKAIPTGNQINWATANVVNVKNIVLERSGADNTFSYLTTLPVTATQFIDISPLAGDNYYRLSSIDNDGSLEVYKNIAFVKGLNNEITFYPNPITNGVLNVVAGDAKLQSVVLYDLSGKKVMVLNNPSHTINTQGLAKGVYVLEINSQKGKVIKKVAVN